MSKSMKFMCHMAVWAIAVAAAGDAMAWDLTRGRTAFKVTGYGTAGMFEPDFVDAEFVGDWRVRGQLNYAAMAGQTVGAVYAIDALALETGRPLREAFGFWESSRYGRVELGMTDSIARKLGVGLPDVGGLRVNDQSLVYKKISPDGPVIADTTLSTGRYALRVNAVSLPTRPVQYGLSVAGLTDDYNFAVDAGMKIRRPTGKVKTAFAMGASFMDAPDNYRADIYAPRVTADWRAQVSAGMNLQYNSWIWGLSARVIYDENPVGVQSDGVAAGTGVSYDLLNYSVSLSYLFTDTGIWGDGHS
ncbi:MAG: hypothetical protein K2L94_00240, partial [Alphaproteobacteria bacterium]|nr:hypothetical protein [Alphaproteobacteria bacterium]